MTVTPRKGEDVLRWAARGSNSSSEGRLKRRQVASRPVGFLSRFSTPCEQDEGNVGIHRPPTG